MRISLVRSNLRGGGLEHSPIDHFDTPAPSISRSDPINSLSVHISPHCNNTPIYLQNHTLKASPSSTADSNGIEQEKYVVSPSGHRAHPDEIIASCQALQAHIQKVQDDAKHTLREWESSVKEQELAEKRRLAPGWLDRDEKMLKPERPSSISGTPARMGIDGSSTNIMDSQDSNLLDESFVQDPQDNAGEELDRAFGGLAFPKN